MKVFKFLYKNWELKLLALALAIVIYYTINESLQSQERARVKQTQK